MAHSQHRSAGPSNEQWDAVCSDTTTTGTRYCRLRIHNGELQSVSSVEKFGS